MSIKKFIRWAAVITVGVLILGGVVYYFTHDIIDKPGTYLRMVMTPEGSPIEERERWMPVVKYLEGEIGMDISMTIATDYSAAVVALDTGYADIAKLGPFSYIMATKEADIEPLVRGVRADTGKAEQTPYIFARADSGIRTLQDLEGKSFSFVDVGSTSGYLVPMATFMKAGIDPETFFSRVVFAGSHDLSIIAVKEGKVDAGCSNSLIWDLLFKEGVVEEGELVIISKGEPIPTDPIVVAASMDSKMKEKLLNAYLNMPEELSIRTFGESKYIQAFDSDYDGIREVAKILNLE